MWDLIYVILLCISIDTLTIVLIWVNQTDIQHASQNFSYMLKFRLEFVVLNQLMSVAARGIRRETMAEKRYHRTSIDDATGADLLEKTSTHRSKIPPVTEREDPTTKISIPQAVLSRGNLPISRSVNFQGLSKESLPSPRNPSHQAASSASRSGDAKVDHAFDHMATQAVPGEGSMESPTTPDYEKAPSTNLVQRSQSGTGDSAQLLDASARGVEPGYLGTLRSRLYQRNEEDENDEDEDEIGLHMWENGGSVVLDAPWFKSKVEV